MSKNKIFLICLILVIVGAINWGLVGLLNIDLVAMIFRPGSMLTRIVYILVGVAGIGAIFTMPREKM